MTQTNKDLITQQNPIKPLQALLAKEVHRKEFFKIIGLGTLMVVGLGPILHFLTVNGNTHITTIKNSAGSTTTYNRGSYNK
jgi:hypothetical protein